MAHHNLPQASVKHMRAMVCPNEAGLQKQSACHPLGHIRGALCADNGGTWDPISDATGTDLNHTVRYSYVIYQFHNDNGLYAIALKTHCDYGAPNAICDLHPKGVGLTGAATENKGFVRGAMEGGEAL